jgi:hypothetical protein
MAVIGQQADLHRVLVQIRDREVSIQSLTMARATASASI